MTAGTHVATPKHEGYCSGEGCAACSHRATGTLRGCEDPSCGWLPDCAGNRAAVAAASLRKLRAIEDGTISRCCLPRTDDEMDRLRRAAGEVIELVHPSRVVARHEATLITITRDQAIAFARDGARQQRHEPDSRDWPPQWVIDAIVLAHDSGREAAERKHRDATLTGSKESNDDELIGSQWHKPFRVYARGERRPLADVIGNGPVVFGCMRFAPVNEDGTVTMTAEALRDLCNHVYREGWRFGNMHERASDGRADNDRHD